MRLGIPGRNAPAPRVSGRNGNECHPGERSGAEDDHDHRLAGPLAARGIGATRPGSENREGLNRLSLRRNFAWTGLANAVYAGCQWGILVALAKAGSAEMVGLFALGLAVTAPVFMFANLQLRSLQATDAKEEYGFADYLGLRLATTLIAQLVVVGIAVVGGYDHEGFWVILAMGATRMLDSLSDVAYGRLQQHERLDRVARSTILRGMLSVVAVPAVVLAGGRLVDGLLAMAAAWALVLMFYDLPQASRLGAAPRTAPARRRTIPRFHLRTLARLSWLAAPLGFVTFLSSLNVNLPRYFVESCVGEAELGVFAGLVGLFSAVYLVQVAIGQAALPRLAQYCASCQGRRFLRLGTVVLATALASGLAGVAMAFVGGAGLLRIIYSDQFAAHVDLFRWLSIAAVAQGASATLGYLLNAARRFRQALAVSLVGSWRPGSARRCGYRGSGSLARPRPCWRGPSSLASCRPRCSSHSSNRCAPPTDLPPPRRSRRRTTLGRAARWAATCLAVAAAISRISSKS